MGCNEFWCCFPQAFPVQLHVSLILRMHRVAEASPTSWDDELDVVFAIEFVERTLDCFELTAHRDHMYTNVPHFEYYGYAESNY